VISLVRAVRLGAIREYGRGMQRLAALLLVACGSSTPTPTPVTRPPVEGTKPADPAPAAMKAETVTADTPKTTVAGNPFTLPKDWSIAVKGPATILTPPENDSWIAIVDVQAKSADAARDLAWAAYKPDHKWPLEGSQTAPDKDGWSGITQFAYTTSPNEKRAVAAATMFANGTWTVILIDVAIATAGKRGSQLGLALGSLLPKGGKQESFAGKQPHALDEKKLAQLTSFVEDSMKTLGVPGVSIGIIQHGKVVFSGGFGVRAIGKPAKPDGDTKYMIASNTKSFTTLMLAKLVDANKLTWDQAATTALPQFKLGDADTTSKVQIKHLICACTGMPRQDLQWILEFQGRTPASVIQDLGSMQPTTKFGELFQYSNVMAAAAGFLGGHVAFPKLELGKAYDEAMRTLVWTPLGMKATTFDYALAQSGNYASPHSKDLDGKTVPALAALNNAVIPVRPAGAAWSTVNDLLKYVAMELAEGKLADGKPYISKEALFARRAKQVAIGQHGAYGMGLFVSREHDVTLIHHGGDVFGFHSDMLWLPEHGVGAVVLTNGDMGNVIRDQFARRLYEVLFDGKPEAAAAIAQAKKSFDQDLELAKKQLTIPADPAELAKLAASYDNAALGKIAVIKKGTKTLFDFGEFQSEIGSKKNPDGSISFVTTSPSITGLELVVAGKTLVLHDAQHEYVFTAR
jgi:CubicO group peptidase (beta-lactamase class C family)